MKYAISDHHWGHKNVIKFENRPFNDVHEMNMYMIDAWNSVITDEDEVYHLGDVGYKINPNYLINEILNKLNGKIHLIPGNHDKRLLNKFIKCGRFESIEYYKELDYDYNGSNYRLIMMHYPILSWNGRFKGSIHIHGHTHKSDFDIYPEGHYGRKINVSVEHLNYKPISLNSIVEKFKDEKIKKI